MAELLEDEVRVPAQLFDRFESRRRHADANGLARDIADLIGARRAFEQELPGILGWGLPGMAGITPGSETDREQVARHIQAAIRRFEPRLTNVEVRPVDGVEEFAFTLEAGVVGQEEEGLRLRILAPRRGGGLSADVSLALRRED